MSGQQWQNFPVPEQGRGWAGFSADPRDPQYQQLRASDADRGNAASMLADAYAEGRLDNDEYNQRLDQTMSSKSLGELVPVLADLTPVRPQPAAASPPSMPQQGRPRGPQGMIGRFPRWWLGLAVMFNLIWLMTVLGTGHWIYYWPMWPMLGTAIPMIMGVVGARVNRQDRIDRRDQRAIDRGYQPPENDLR